jgi:LppP/LprE lipoprotein
MPAMIGSRSLSLALAVALVGAALAACGGSGTKVVTSSKPPSPLTSGSSTPSTGTVSSASTSSPAAGAAGGAGTGGTPAQGAARTQTAPAYAHEESSSGALAKALETVRAHGYSPSSSTDYHPEQSLRVLVGTRGGSGHEQQAFFFLGERYLGTDSSQPSGAVHVVSQGDTEVTLGYSIYGHGDSLCCPSGGEAHVTFQLNNGTLVPVQTIPAASSRR